MPKFVTGMLKPGQQLCEKCLLLNDFNIENIKFYHRIDFGTGDLAWPKRVKEIGLCDKHSKGYELFTGGIDYIPKKKIIKSLHNI